MFSFNRMLGLTELFMTTYDEARNTLQLKPTEYSRDKNLNSSLKRLINCDNVTLDELVESKIIGICLN